MALEGRKRLGGIERRFRNAPMADMLRPIAHRILHLRVSLEDVFSGKSGAICVRSGDLVNKKLREAVAGVLGGIVGANVLSGAGVAVVENVAPVVAEPESLEKSIPVQYYDALGVLKKFGLYGGLNSIQGDVDVPTLGVVKDILGGFTSDQNAVIGRMKKRVLQLIPITSMARYMRALNWYKPIEGQTDAMVFDWYKCVFAGADALDGVKSDSTADLIVGWRIAITEGAEEPVLDGDNVSNTLAERIDWFVGKFGEIGVSGVDLKRMILLMMDSLVRGKLLNSIASSDGLCTVVNGEPQVDENVPVVSWIYSINRVSMMFAGCDDPHEHAVFRTSVMKDVPRS